jgi:hypothetical protein
MARATSLALAVLLLVLAASSGAAADRVVGADAFGRTATEGWGTADQGGTWTTIGNAKALTVSGGAGMMALPAAGAGRGAMQSVIDVRDVDLVARFRIDRLPAGGSVYAYLVGRRQGTTEYRLKVRVGPSGGIYLQATRVVGGTETDIGTETKLSGVTLGAGADLLLHGRIADAAPTRLRLRAWAAGTAEPAGWTVDQTDATAALEAPGQAGLRAYLGSGVSNGPVTVAFDDWTAIQLDTAPAPTPVPEPTPGPTPVPTPEPTPDVPANAIAADDFGRTASAGFGSALVGGSWSYYGTLSDFTLGGDRAHIRTAPGKTRGALLTASGRDLQAKATVWLDELPVGSSAWFYLVLRRTAGNEEIRARLRVAADGAAFLGISTVVGGVETVVGSEARVTGVTMGRGQRLTIRARGVGSSPTTWSMRAWDPSAEEPSGWPLVVTDATTALQGSGTVGLRTYLSRSATNAALTFQVDDYLVRPAEAAPTPTPKPTPAPTPKPTPKPDGAVLVGAGDIVGCGGSGAVATAALLDAIPGTVFAAGDLVYPDGTAQEFADCFGPTWGRYKARMLPALGNHEYHTAGAAGYFGYFGAAAAGPGGYYATDVGAWRVYVLNSECAEVSCAAGSPQVRWLIADLAANPRECVMAIWHEPRFSSGPHGDSAAVGAFWDALYAAGAELVVSGHDHGYERFLPMVPSGASDPARGIVQFVAGTGGIGGADYASVRANSVVRNGSTFGVLKLTLRAGSYDWQFVPVAGATFTDSGTGSCHPAP